MKDRRKFNAVEKRIAREFTIAEAKDHWQKRYDRATPAERERMQLRGSKR